MIVSASSMMLQPSKKRKQRASPMESARAVTKKKPLE
jgi:hypothetical protein